MRLKLGLIVSIRRGLALKVHSRASAPSLTHGGTDDRPDVDAVRSSILASSRDCASRISLSSLRMRPCCASTSLTSFAVFAMIFWLCSVSACSRAFILASEIAWLRGKKDRYCVHATHIDRAVQGHESLSQSSKRAPQRCATALTRVHDTIS
eukprot:6783287-Prymnesium_polylepis.3